MRFDSRIKIVLSGIGLEAGLGVVACLVGWAVGISPLRTLHLRAGSAAIGVLAALPLLFLFQILRRTSWAPLRRIARLLDDALKPLLRDASALELWVLAAAAGFGEEALFRGLIQGGAERLIGNIPAWIAASLLFGACHFITPLYAGIVSVVGLYLGALWWATADLLTPLVTHAVYDAIALLLLLRQPDPKDATGGIDLGQNSLKK